METRSNAPADLPRQKLQFSYGYLGRRVEKIVSDWNGSAWVESDHRKFLYDGFNLVGEFDDNSGIAPIRTYTWGLDLSGTIQGAGGVGGLVGMEDHTGGQVETYLPTYDGNGNVVALIDAADGTIVAEYEYGPYGEPLRATGPYSKQNPFRFSTKYLDTETGLYYYGFRYYTPELGRFLNRDPLGESGGANLYGFVGNNPVNNWDLLGLRPPPTANDCVNPNFPGCPGDDQGDGVIESDWLMALAHLDGRDHQQRQETLAWFSEAANQDRDGSGETVTPGVLTPTTETLITGGQCACTGPVYEPPQDDPIDTLIRINRGPGEPLISNAAPRPGGSTGGGTPVTIGGGDGSGGDVDGGGSTDDNGNPDQGSGSDGDGEPGPDTSQGGTLTILRSQLKALVNMSASK